MPDWGREPGLKPTAFAPPTDNAGASPVGAPEGVAASLDRGWSLVEDCRLGLGSGPPDIVLLHPGIGVALLEMEPRWTPDAETAFRQRLDAIGFAQDFPGHLPVIHRRLRPIDLPELPVLLAEAFSWQPRLTLPEGGAWTAAARRALLSQPAGTSNAPPDAAEAHRMDPPGAAAPANWPQDMAAPPGLPARGKLALGVTLALAAGLAGYVMVQGVPGSAPQAASPAPLAVRQVIGRPELDQQVPPTPAPAIASPAPSPSPTPPPVPAEPAPVELAQAPVAAPPPATWQLAPESAPADPPTELADLPFVLPPDDTDTPLALPVDLSDLLVLLPPEPSLEANTSEAGTAEVGTTEVGTAPMQLAALPTEAPPEPLPLPAELAQLPFVALPAPPPEPLPLPAELVELPFVAPPAPPPEPLPLPAELVQLPFVAPPAPPPEPLPLPAELVELPFVAPPAPPPEPLPLPAELAQLPFVAPPAPPPEPLPLPAELVQLPFVAPPAPAPVPAAPTPSAPSAPAQAARPAAPQDPPALVTAMLRRGEALLEIGDVSGARRFFERAAQSGSGPAALAMGATYDPLQLAAIGARGIPPERATALRWYQRALALGAPEAQRRIQALEATP